jgi:hypothetical protein
MIDAVRGAMCASLDRLLEVAGGLWRHGILESTLLPGVMPLRQKRLFCL